MAIDTDRAAEQRAEQDYFDAAYDVREEKREVRRQAALSAGDGKAARRLHVNAADDRTLGSPADEVAFLRLDTSEDQCFYVGKHAILGPDGDVVVYPWQAPAIMKMREATVEDPGALKRRREFRTLGNYIDSFEDLLFAEIAARLEALDDPELALIQSDRMLDEELTRDRSPEMRQIAQTIQALQSRLIRTPLETLFILQGGPGTGKTAVALHRVSWLLHNYRDRLGPRDVLVVGPNPTFTRYINRVLPELGDEHVAQTDVLGMLQAPVTARLKESAETSALKGDDRMEEVISRGLRDRIRGPREDTTFAVERAPWRVTLEASAVAQMLQPLSADFYAIGRSKFRDQAFDAISARVRRRFEEDGTRVGVDARTLLSTSEVDAFVERVWPQLSPQAFLRDLFGSVERLLSAARGTLSAEQVTLLRRQAAPRLAEEQWSKEDLVLLDAVAAEINGDPETYKHIVVDEAQDLSPMQLQAIRRRSHRGSMTIVGDIAQSTGHWARGSWDDVQQALRTSLPVHVEELTHGYRVPKAVMKLAARLLPLAAPGVTAPVVVRDVERGPQFVSVPAEDDFAEATLAAVQAHSAKGRFVGVVCPASRRPALEEALEQHRMVWRNADEGSLGTSINLVSPVAAKGLEFDAVVVVDPADIVEAGPEGYRMLYIALTRTTKDLDIVHPAGALPTLLRDEADIDPDTQHASTTPVVEETATVAGAPAATPDLAPEQPAQPVPSPDRTTASSGESARSRTVRFQAQAVLDQLAETVPSGLWVEVLEEALRSASSGPSE